MTDRTNDQMTDETRDEIVRLARKGWTVDKVASWLTAEAIMAKRPEDQVAVERVQAVVDEADREVERMLTPTCEPSVPQASQRMGRRSKAERLQSIIAEAIRQDKTKWLAEEMAGGPVSYARLRKWYMDLGMDWGAWPSVPATGQTTVLAANDAIGRIAKWLDDARESGMDSRTMAKALSDAAGEMAADALDGRLEDTDAEWLANWLDKSASATT